MERKIRVLFVGHTYLIGVNQQKLVALARTGKIEIGLIVPHRWRAADLGHTFELDPPPVWIRTFRLPSFANGRGGAYLLDPAGAMRAIRSFRPDVIHVEQEVFALSSFQFALLARASRIPSIYFGWENTDRPLALPRRWTRKYVLKQARAVICGNRDNERLVRRWGFTRETILAPQLGVDPQFFRPKSVVARSQQEFTIGFVGRLVHEKGVDLLLTAFAGVIAECPNARLVIAGTGPLKRALLELAHELAIADRISWRDFLPHAAVPEFMQQLDVLVLPSRSVAGWKEQFGHVLIEAMSTGVPVIGSDCGEIPNVIGREDLVFPEKDHNTLKSILARMYNDSSWRRDIGRFCIRRVNERYTHDRIAEQLVDLYRRVIADEYSCRKHA